MRINTIIIGLLIFVGVSAQNDKKVEFLFNIGANISIPDNKSVDMMPELDFNDITEFRSNFGYFTEFMMIYNISNQIGIQSGINYNLGKMSISQTYGNLASESIVSTSYIHIPILISWKPFDSFPMTFSGGPYFGILLTAHHDGDIIVDTSQYDLLASDEFSIVAPISDDTRDLKQYYYDYDYGLSFQIDYEFLINKEISMTLFSRFNLGLKDVISDVYGIYDQYSVFQHYNLGLMIGTGVRF